MRVLAIDPGANPGFCATVAVHGAHVLSRFHTHDSAEAQEWGAATGPWDELVVEDQHAATALYRNGRRVRVSRKSQISLGFVAGRLFERFPATRKYRISADAWRAVLWPGSRRLPKKVVLARLLARPDAPDLSHVPAKNRPDVVEAWGIALAWAELTPAQKRKFEVRE